jgi:hypothetical protein
MTDKVIPILIVMGVVAMVIIFDYAIDKYFDVFFDWLLGKIRSEK